MHRTTQKPPAQSEDGGLRQRERTMGELASAQPNSAVLSQLLPGWEYGKSRPNPGLPSAMKERVERLTGASLDGVQVHRNSDKPARLGAEAYAQGEDVYLGPGREERLEHELRHVAQQRQGLVQPTNIINGTAVNLDRGFEQAAEGGTINASAVGSEASYSPVIQCYIPRIEQNGPNCGVYALTMALMDLRGTEKPTSEEEVKQLQTSGDEIAAAIQEGAVKQGLSSMGEFFSAENLSQAANLFLGGKEDDGLTTQTMTFANEDELDALIDQANENGVRVLIAFSAENAVESGKPAPPPGEGVLPPARMDCAHWGVIKKSKHPEKPITIREGHQTSKASLETATSLAIDTKTLFDSNAALNNQMNWDAYIAKTAKSESEYLLESGISKEGAEMYAKGEAASLTKRVDDRRKTAPNQFVAGESGKQLVEKVDLKGKVVLVGKKADIAKVEEGISATETVKRKVDDPLLETIKSK